MKTLTVLWMVFCLTACGSATSPADPCKGKCQSFEVCTVDGRCLADCHPECGNRVCGKEPVCNTSCGECENDKECTSSGACSSTITLPEQAYNFKIDLDILGSLLRTNPQCVVDKTGIAHKKDDNSLCELFMAELPFDTQYTDLSTLPELAPYVQANRIKSVESIKLRFEITENTANYSAVETLFYVGGWTITKPNCDIKPVPTPKVTIIEEIPAQLKMYSELYIITNGNCGTVQDIFNKFNGLKYNYIGKTAQLKSQDGQALSLYGHNNFDGKPIPTGNIRGTLYLSIKFNVDY